MNKKTLPVIRMTKRWWWPLNRGGWLIGVLFTVSELNNFRNLITGHLKMVVVNRWPLHR